MKYHAEILIMPHKELLDPQGKTVAKNLFNLDIYGVDNVRIGKCVELNFESASEEAAHGLVKETCERLLTNMITEKYHYTLTTV